ncbi:MAG: cytochrome b/b6 domain-containing protein [Rhizobiaceae bacterium]
MTTAQSMHQPEKGPLIYRQNRWTRFTHWTWAACLFFLLFSGLQIFNAHPTLYIGKESGFGYDNAVFSITAVEADGAAKGVTKVFGAEFNTTGLLGVSGPQDNRQFRAFPAALTIPSYYDLGTARVVHFFFAWLLVATLTVWAAAGLWNGHIRGDLTLSKTDLNSLLQDIKDHARLRFHHTGRYNVLQKLAYGGVLFLLFPAIILTGLAMSPSLNALVPFLADMLGGRQSARTIHFLAMLLLVGFVVIHMVMIVAAGPLNELRSIITGWYRTEPQTSAEEKHNV